MVDTICKKLYKKKKKKKTEKIKENKLVCQKIVISAVNEYKINKSLLLSLEKIKEK